MRRVSLSTLTMRPWLTCEATATGTVLADWRLRDSIDAIGEAKLKIDNAAFGEVVNSARHICYQQDSPIYTKILLYDKTDFWMIRATRGEISSVNISEWGTCGSRQQLRTFIQDGRSPWVGLLIVVCEKWNLDVQKNAFLGKGSFGRVFKVSSRDAAESGRKVFKALKLVLPGDNGSGGVSLFKEKEAIEKAAKAVPEHVARVENFIDLGQFGAALLLSDFGAAVPRQEWRLLFSSLGALHEAKIVHGDARLPNAVCVGSDVRWIDFQGALVATSEPRMEWKRADMKTLVSSCFHYDESVAGSPVEDLVEQYEGTAVSASLLYDAIIGATQRNY